MILVNTPKLPGALYLTLLLRLHLRSVEIIVSQIITLKYFPFTNYKNQEDEPEFINSRERFDLPASGRKIRKRVLISLQSE